MADNSRIEWTESTWNPITGCTKVSAGCANCYAERMAKRLHAMGAPTYYAGFAPRFHPSVLGKPRGWKRSRLVFVNSMSDTFHEEIADLDILRIFKVMNECRWHTFQVLTKRSERLLSLAGQINWTPNIWLGVTVESGETRHRIEDLRRVNAGTRFLSLEPLLGPVPGLNLKGMHWVIVGGESGPNSRPMKPAWVLDIKDKCARSAMPFFFKQWGGPNKKKTGRLLENRTWDEMPILTTAAW